MTETTEIFLAAAREWIGRETGIRWGTYPVEHEPIRRWCRMVDLVNPLYLDPEYAHKTRWGRCLCPPLMIPLFGGSTEGVWTEWPSPPEASEENDITPPLPGNRNIGTGSEFEFFKPVLVGDHLGYKLKLIDVFLRPTRFDRETFWLKRQTDFINQHLEVVAIRTGVSIRFRESSSVTRRSPVDSRSIPRPTTGAPYIQAGQKRQIYFEEVEIGQEIPGFSLHLDRLRFALQTSGSQTFGSFHIDEDFARSQGLPTVFIDASFTKAALSRIVIQWMGDEGWLQKFSLQMKRMHFLGDTLTVRGKVAGKSVKENQGYVDCELWGENQRDSLATSGQATLILPLYNQDNISL